MALCLTWGALPPREELPPQAWGWGSKPQIPLPLESRDGAFPSTTAHTHTHRPPPSLHSFSSLLLKCLFPPLRSLCTPAREMRSFLSSSVLLTSRGTWVNDFPPNSPAAAFKPEVKEKSSKWEGAP